MTEIAAMVEALSLLTPCEIPSVQKLRVGNFKSDGGYVMVNRFRPGQKVYSYGISTEISFDHFLAKRGLLIFMYDHTISQLPYDHMNFSFAREGIAPVPDEGARLYPLEYHVRKNGHADVDMILKLDVEGAEWGFFDAVSPALLARFEQIVIEIHDLDKLAEPEFRAQFTRVFSKLTALFHLVHVHSNNTVPLRDFDGLQVPVLLELSLLRKDVGPAKPWRTFIPSEWDAPNTPGPDHVLGFFPFLPTELPGSAVKAGLIGAFQLALGSDERRVALAMAALQRRGTNIARGGRCSQSSLSRWSVAPDEAQGALREVKTGGFAFHTALENGPWWQIDLGRLTVFDEILCFNRLDQCSDRARGMCVELSDDGATWHIVHQERGPFGGADGDPLRVTNPRMAARYVRLRVPAYTALHLDAVEIFDWEAV